MEVLDGIKRNSLIYLGSGNSETRLIIIHPNEDLLIFGDVDSQSNNTIPVYDQN